jgi:AraC family transcriptional regulator, transcriptional activator of pobA
LEKNISDSKKQNNPKNTDLRPMKDIFPHYHIGHFVNQPDKPLDFEITRFEEMGELDIEDPHKHTFYEILWFDEGRSTQVIDYREYDIQPGTLFFISPNQLHHFVEYQPLKGGSVFFTEHFFLLGNPDRERLFELTFLDNFFTTPFLQPDNQTFSEIKLTIDLLFNEKKRSDWSPSIAQSLLQILLAQIQRSIDSGEKEAVSKRSVVLFKKLKTLLDQHFQEALTANDYARKLNVTQHYLNLICKSVAGKTTSEIIRARSILEAKRLLMFSDYTVSEIATDLGYLDLSYFAKVFRAETGMAPIEFKREMSEKYRNL